MSTIKVYARSTSPDGQIHALPSTLACFCCGHAVIDAEDYIGHDAMESAPIPGTLAGKLAGQLKHKDCKFDANMDVRSAARAHNIDALNTAGVHVKTGASIAPKVTGNAPLPTVKGSAPAPAPMVAQPPATGPKARPSVKAPAAAPATPPVNPPAAPPSQLLAKTPAVALANATVIPAADYDALVRCNVGAELTVYVIGERMFIRDASKVRS